MPNDKSEAQKFFDSLPSEENNESFDLNKELNAGKQEVPEVKQEEPVQEPEKDKEQEDDDSYVGKRQNRRERRQETNRFWEEQLKARDAQIEKLQTAILERTSSETKEEYDARLTRLFGDTPQGKEAGRIVQEMLKEVEDRAKAPYRELEEARSAEAEVEARFDEQIENGLADVEDSFGIDLTSRSAAKLRSDFLDFVDELSPDDSLVNFEKAWEIFNQGKTARPSKEEVDRKKQVASRSIQRSSTARPDPSKLQPVNFEQVDNIFTRMFRK